VSELQSWALIQSHSAELCPASDYSMDMIFAAGFPPFLFST